MSICLSHLVERFLSYMQGRNSPGTIYYYRLHLTRWIAAIGDMPVEEIRRHHLLEWARTWHNVQTVQRLFAWAHSQMEIIPRNPFHGIKKPAVVGRKRVLSRHETARLLRGAERSFRNVLLALRESIARPQEIRALTWDKIRWEGVAGDLDDALLSGQAWFQLDEYKSRRQRRDPSEARRILINGRLGSLLVRLRRHVTPSSRHVFVTHLGKAWTTSALRLRMRRLCRRAGVADDARGERAVLYTFRHTAATNACANGVPDRVLCELMGHTSTRTTSRYQHVNLSHLRAAVKRLDDEKRPKKTE